MPSSGSDINTSEYFEKSPILFFRLYDEEFTASLVLKPSGIT